MSNHIFETYNNSVIPHGCNSNKTEYGMVMANICAYPLSQHISPHWKCLFCSSENYPRIDILQYTMYVSTARGSSLGVNDRTMDVRVTSDRPSTP